MTTRPVPPLAPAIASALGEFARVCRAAARAVSLYPADHPTIHASLARLIEVTDRITARGAFRLSVQPDVLLINQAAPARPDVAVAELAELLHAHLIGTLVLHGGTDVDAWRVLLLLLARPPGEVRGEGGIAHLWQTEGSPGIEIQEIDYAEVLRERGYAGDDATFETFIEACLKDTSPNEWDDALLQRVLALAAAPESLEALTQQVLDRAAAQGAAGHADAFVRLLRGLAEIVSRAKPDLLDPILRRAAASAGSMPADAMLAMLTHGRSGHEPGTLDVVDGLVGRMSDPTIAGFVAGSVIREHRASERLAEALQALVPDVDRKRQIVAAAEAQAAATELAREVSFVQLWQAVEDMLLSYSDEPFVSAEYARELSTARSSAVAIEQVTDDPPELVASWVATVSDSALRALDLFLLLDLLSIEDDPARWRDVSDIAATEVEALARSGQLESACRLARALVDAGRDGATERTAIAAATMARLGRHGLIRHVVLHLRTGDDHLVAQVRDLVQLLGLPTIDALAEAMSVETDARTRARLRDLLVSFGSDGRASIERLMSSENWEVRRTAAYLLRELGGSAALSALEPLLQDAEPLVQREAINALVRIGDDRAFAMLTRALETGAMRVRETLMQELLTQRDPLTGPLFCYLLRHLDHRSALAGAYLSAIAGLGAIGGDEQAVEALLGALHRGEWWAPIRTRRIRDAAAAALARLDTPAAVAALRQAAAGGPRGVRRAVRAHLDSAGAGAA